MTTQLRTDIIFQVDSSKLVTGGSLTNPLPIVHPPMFLKQSACAPAHQDGDYPVVIGPQEDVFIYVADANNDMSVRMAPCGLIVHDLGGVSLTNDKMTDPAQQPITLPNFSEDLTNVPYIKVDPGTPAWHGVPESYANWAGYPMVSQGVTKMLKNIYGPYVHFNGTGDTDVTGKLQYGIIFMVTRFDAHNKQTEEYFYFDPYLVINGDVGKRADFASRAKMAQASRK